VQDSLFQSLSSIPRSRMRALWDQAKHHDFADLAENEREVLLIMIDHDQEYFEMFEQADRDGRFVSDGEVDPYIHVILHHIIERQVEKREPVESHRFYYAMRERGCTHHEAIHLTMLIFAEFAFNMLHDDVPFDDNAYTNLLGELTDRNPDQIQSFVEQAFSG